MNEILTDDDYAIILRTVVTDAGKGGIEKAEAVRRVELIADHVREWKISAAMYELFSTRGADVLLTDDESDVRILARKETP
ncbi:hypothetical protein [Streptomyces anulatus]|uniref:hypothetical protein n=1 Tax=Streptomyces anulatus TaxID=1892 RepID=UPI003867E632|nr:hypothetical protein OHB50_04120 [Streptomyces anulatus]